MTLPKVCLALGRRVLWLALLVNLAWSPAAHSEDRSVSPGKAFDPEVASQAYLQRPTQQEKARSDAYFEGGYWLQLWQYLFGAGLSLMLLQTGLSARMRDLACRCSRLKPVHTTVYAIQYILLTAVVTLPLSIYSDFLREHKYGLATQGFGGWFGDWLKGLLVGIILGSLIMIALFGVVRRMPRTWHLWGSAVLIAFLVILTVIAPVFIAPLFNKYTLLDKPEVVEPILRLARANGIASDKVFQMDASRQSTRVSANVSGLLSTMRITLNDNLLRRCSLPEIKAVMAHEMGHYVLNHVYKGTLFFSVLIVLGFAFLYSALQRLLSRFGSRWGIAGPVDLAVVPLVVLLFSTYFFVLTPITNTLTRTQEMEADMFGLNAAREPDGFAEVTLKLGEYRKLQPGPIEEWIFYDHPSGATRIRAAMRWKSENLSPDARP
jgi:STE24 endopeptidase